MAVAANSLANLRPWTAEDRRYIGQPKRPPPTLTSYIRSQTVDGREMADFMLAILRGQSVKPPGRARVRLRYHPSIRDRMQAADWLANRAFGMPREFVEVTDGDTTRAARQTLIASMAPEDREALMALLRRAIESQAQALPAGPAPTQDGPHA